MKWRGAPFWEKWKTTKPGQLAGRWLVVVSLVATVEAALVAFLWSEFSACKAAGDAYLPCDMKLTASMMESDSMSLVLPSYPMRGPMSWTCLSPEARDVFTMGGSIKKLQSMMFNTKPWRPGDVIKYKSLKTVWTNSTIQEYKKGAPEDKSPFGKRSIKDLEAAFKDHPVKGKSVLVYGTRQPWLELFLLSNHCKNVTSVDYNPPSVDKTRDLRVLHVSELSSTVSKFDVIVAYSTVQHDGLGGFGDPINPNGDLMRMASLRQFLRGDGVLFLAVPMGRDRVHWNSHRVYGEKRFPLLIRGWMKLETYEGYDMESVYAHFSKSSTSLPQPLHVLAPEPSQELALDDG